MKTVRGRVGLGVLLATLALGLPALGQLVLAHAEFDTANPAPGSTVAAPPARVLVRYTEELDPDGSTLTVTGPDGATADTGDGAADLSDPDRTSMTATLKPNLPDGVYTVAWTTKSATDGDVADGTYSFTVDPNAVAAASPTASVSAPVIAPAPGITPSPLPEPASDDSGLGRGTLIVGGLAIVVALVVVASVGGRAWWRR